MPPDPHRPSGHRAGNSGEIRLHRHLEPVNVHPSAPRESADHPSGTLCGDRPSGVRSCRIARPATQIRPEFHRIPRSGQPGQFGSVHLFCHELHKLCHLRRIGRAAGFSGFRPESGVSGFFGIIRARKFMFRNALMASASPETCHDRRCPSWSGPAGPRGAGRACGGAFGKPRCPETAVNGPQMAETGVRPIGGRQSS